MGFADGSDRKESACNAEDLGWVPGSGRSPGERNGYPLLPGESPGQRSLVDCSPWGCREKNDWATNIFTFKDMNLEDR